MDDYDANARAERARHSHPFLNTAQAAHYVGLHYHPLEHMRRRGRGPRFGRPGRHIRYHIDDLEQWSLTNGQDLGSGEAD